MRALIANKKILPIAMILLVFLIGGCAETTYIYQNGSTYNDYEVATNYRISSASSKPKRQTSKAPNWRKYNHQNKYKRYN